ncbi:unnamed protein product [Trifolium pratense]|uniref:Uncharacterized protein n=1 Tax=Trifolium pratense TaxID=57577 RepID=A0ACB0J6P6_TRIPR|nr:unnamed protein product [Trifolium pratense]
MFLLSFQNWVCSQELLRHFWSSYPVTTQSLVNKARRLKDVISQIDTKLEEIKVSAQSDLRHQVSLVVHPKHQALEAALVHYGAEIRKEMLKGQSQMVMFRRMVCLCALPASCHNNLGIYIP